MKRDALLGYHQTAWVSGYDPGSSPLYRTRAKLGFIQKHRAKLQPCDKLTLEAALKLWTGHKPFRFEFAQWVEAVYRQLSKMTGEKLVPEYKSK